MLAGDINNGLRAVEATGIVQQVQGSRCTAGRRPTCVTSRSQSLIDFFVVLQSITNLATKVGIN